MKMWVYRKEVDEVYFLLNGFVSKVNNFQENERFVMRFVTVNVMRYAISLFENLVYRLFAVTISRSKK